MSVAAAAPAADRPVRPSPAQQSGWLRRMWPYLTAHRRDMLVVFGAALLGMAITATLPLLVRAVVDDAVAPAAAGSPARDLAPLLVAMIVLSLLRFALSFARRFGAGRLGIDVEYDMRNDIYDHLHRLDFARHDELQSGQLVSRANSDVRIVQTLLGFLPFMSGSVLLFFLSLTFMVRLSPPLTAVALVTVPILLVMAMRMRSVVYPSSWDAQQRAAEVATVVEEATSGVRVVKGFGQEGRELSRLSEAAVNLFGARMRNARISAQRQAVMQTIPALAQVGILALGGWLTMQGDITLGTLLAFQTYLLQLVAPVRQFAGMLVVASTARAAAERIFELLDSTSDVVEKPGALELPPARGEVVFDDVSFGYLRSEPVLDGFSLRVAPGEVVALVGASGSGKSTVSLLLPRFYDPQRGSITLDGVDVRDVTLDSLRHNLGVVFEESFLFSETIRANISYGRPDAHDEDVRRAARWARADEFIEALPEGYDTVVGERGLTLSGGQRQRIALARALLTDPQVMLLDDATSSIDVRIEEEIHETLREVMRGRTTILVAHRRSTLNLADRIVVLDGGRVVDAGTHHELTARCPLYRQLLGGDDDLDGFGAVEATPPDGHGHGHGTATATATVAATATGPRSPVCPSRTRRSTGSRPRPGRGTRTVTSPSRAPSARATWPPARAWPPAAAWAAPWRWAAWPEGRWPSGPSAGSATRPRPSCSPRSRRYRPSSTRPTSTWTRRPSPPPASPSARRCGRRCAGWCCRSCSWVATRSWGWRGPTWWASASSGACRATTWAGSWLRPGCSW